MYRITLIIEASQEDEITEKLFELGAQSVSSSAEEPVEVTLMAIFDDIDPVTGFFSQDRYIIEKLEEEVWKYRWLEQYQGFPVTDDIYIIPVSSEDPPPAQYRYAIRLDPRDAFGDGRHPTTFLCLVHLEKTLRSLPEQDTHTVALLDAGTGTGVLAILAAKMGLMNIDAVDIDPVSVENALYNATINGTPDIEFTAAALEQFWPGRTYDIIVANLLTDIIKKNLQFLRALLRDSGTMILSGISDLWCHEAEEAFRQHGLAVKEHANHDGWNCYVLRKI